MGREEKKRKEKKVFPATTQASKDTPKEERRRVPSYFRKHPGTPKQEGGKGKDGEKREREKRRKRTGVSSYAQASRDTPMREG